MCSKGLQRGTSRGGPCLPLSSFPTNLAENYIHSWISEEKGWVNGLCIAEEMSQCLSLFCNYVSVYLLIIKDTLPGTAINKMGGTQEVQRRPGPLTIRIENASWHFSEKGGGMVGGRRESSFLWCFDIYAPVSNKSGGPGLSDFKWDCDITQPPFRGDSAKGQDGLTSKNSAYNVIKMLCGSLEVLGFKNEIRQSLEENGMFQELGFM